MPNNAEHCEDSLRRYGKTFAELHRWMDEPSTLLGPTHRRYRHDPHTTPQEAKAIFGENSDNACLDHIRLDELESRRKGTAKHPNYLVYEKAVKHCSKCGANYSSKNEKCPYCEEKSGLNFTIGFEKSQDLKTTETSWEQMVKRCPKCNAIFCFQNDNCPYCGNELSNS
jgi:RNA polymerase subunit RPABC4/transcription elongation factor Spt4